MSGTLSFRLHGTLTNQLHTEEFGSATPRTLIQSGNAALNAAVVSVGTSEENLSTEDIGVDEIGYLYMRNLDTGNYVEWGPNFAGSRILLGRLDPSGEAWIKMDYKSGPTLRWKSINAPCKVQVKLFGK